MAALYQCLIADQGAAEGQPACSVFTADTLAHAQAFAQSLSTLMQRSVSLAALYQAGSSPLSPPWQIFTAGSSGSSVSSNGISF